mmetsp:Transcript_811/g.1286  ORF Transcript_811/g.1286 Transcript_811/m.1286 type:complete len:133 (-) Transcript_811:410-808(-)
MSSTHKTKNIFRAVGPLIKRTGGRCLYDLVYGLPDNGVGRLVQRGIWQRYPQSYIKLTRVEAYSTPRTQLKRGKAYGIKYWKGETNGIERRLHTTNKRDWVWYDPEAPINSNFSVEPKSTTTSSSTTAEQEN